ncbi:hypothetical protein QR680_015788 [Steinernema hermaphroditum]|uniref:RxLR effector protein n=1 Tax=Steinernema hermaphroditum TaxID=289476 RepID=A0AA39LL71_9BILA|nr:hypothetical protein QR680_015788 [Steinernema hermaphroditum]
MHTSAILFAVFVVFGSIIISAAAPVDKSENIRNAAYYSLKDASSRERRNMRSSNKFDLEREIALFQHSNFLISV